MLCLNYRKNIRRQLINFGSKVSRGFFLIGRKTSALFFCHCSASFNSSNYSPASKNSGVLCFSSVRPFGRVSVRPSACNQYFPSSVTMHHSHFKLGMVLWLGVLHVAYRIQVSQLFTSCFTTYLIFRLSVCYQYFPTHFSRQPCITATSNLVWCFG